MSEFLTGTADSPIRFSQLEVSTDKASWSTRIWLDVGEASIASLHFWDLMYELSDGVDATLKFEDATGWGLLVFQQSNLLEIGGYKSGAQALTGEILVGTLTVTPDGGTNGRSLSVGFATTADVEYAVVGEPPQLIEALPEPVESAYTLTGYVRSWNNSTLLAGASVDANESMGMSDLGGSFQVESIVDDDGLVNVKGSLTSPANKSEASITLTDVLGALKVYLGKPLPTAYDNPYKYIAADFQGDGDVDLSDVLSLLKYYLGKPVESAPEWVFADAADEGLAADGNALSKSNATPHAIDHDLTVSSELELVGILRGDVDGSWMPPAA